MIRRLWRWMTRRQPGESPDPSPVVTGKYGYTASVRLGAIEPPVRAEGVHIHTEYTPRPRITVVETGQYYDPHAAVAESARRREEDDQRRRIECEEQEVADARRRSDELTQSIIQSASTDTSSWSAPDPSPAPDFSGGGGSFGGGGSDGSW